MGKFVDAGYNISDDQSFRFPAQTSRTNTDPRLATNAPQDNGGPTNTIAVRPNSPAVNDIPIGTNGCGAPIESDQRGVSWPQGSGCDIGAFEREVPQP